MPDKNNIITERNSNATSKEITEAQKDLKNIMSGKKDGFVFVANKTDSNEYTDFRVTCKISKASKAEIVRIVMRALDIKSPYLLASIL